MKKLLLTFILALGYTFIVSAQNPNCESCETFSNANLYLTLIEASLEQVSPDDCNTFEVCFPVLSEDCDNLVARINWGDGSDEEEINAIPANPGDLTDCIQHTYSSTTPTTISISIVLNDIICETRTEVNVPFNKNCIIECESPCDSNPAIFISESADCAFSFISLHEVDDCIGAPNFSWNFTNSSITTSTDISPSVSPLNNGPLTATLNLTYTLPDGTQCTVSSMNTVEVNCLEDNSCGICTDTEDDFPLVSNSYDLVDFSRLFGKTITSDCSGNVYSLGNWNGDTTLNKFDLNGNIIWNQNINIGTVLSSSNIVIEVDDNEAIYIKNNDQIFKYDNNGIIDWEIQINDNLLSNRSNFTIKNDTGDIYLPVSSNFTLVNDGTTTSFSFPNSQRSIVRIDTNANITDLGAFTSSGILNLHYNNGLKVWSRNLSGIEYRKYIPNSDILEDTNTTWVNNFLISQFDSFTPLFYNNINNKVLIYTGNQLAPNNSNTRILSIGDDGILNNNENILLPEALYIGQHLLAYHAPFAFNTNNGELAIYADNSTFSGNILVSTISSNFELETKNLTQASFGSNPFYSRSFHAITYGGDCLYFYGQYRSNNNVVLDGGITLPSSGGTNNARSTIVRLQDDLEIRTPLTRKTVKENKAIVTPNPVKNNTIHVKTKEDYKGKISYMLRGISGNLIQQAQNFIIKNQEFDIRINRKTNSILFLEIRFDNGHTESIKVVIE